MNNKIASKSARTEIVCPTDVLGRTWSPYQLAVFDDVANGKGHTVVKAVAGSGKTTTIVVALSYVPAGMSTLFCAFNKSIAEELAKRAPKGVTVSTLHSYGYRCVKNTFGTKLRIDDRRVFRLIKEMQQAGKLEMWKIIQQIQPNEKTTEISFDLMRDLQKTVSLAKGALAFEEEDLDRIIDEHEIEAPKRTPVPGVIVSAQIQESVHKAFIKDVAALLIRCADVSDLTIDFDDMIWLPVLHDLPQPKYDRVFIDETQDLNPCQIELALRAVKADGRICAVGDPRQAIYRFRGADSQAVDNVVRRLSAKVLPLSVCYRCCQAVIRKAQKIVPEIEWAPGAIEGEVTNATKEEMVKKAKPGQFILSRTNAPLVSLCMRFLRENRPATIQGRDIGVSLASFVKKSAAPSVEALCDYVEQWRDIECTRLAKKDRDTQAVEDKAECILAIAEGAKTVEDVVWRIENLFADKDDSSRIVLSSTHKAKGMERDTVWMLESTYQRRPGIEEENLAYVAYTRARNQLILVQGQFGKKPPKELTE